MDWSKSQLQVAFKQLRNYLFDDEEIEYAVVARNHPNSIYIRPCLLATDRRLVYLEPKMFGLSSTPQSFKYSDFADIHLDKGFFTHKISMTPYPGLGLAAVMVDHLEKRRAEAFYTYVQGRIGRHNVPGLLQPEYQEDTFFAPNPPPAVNAKPASPKDEDDPIFSKLKQLKQLHDEGLLTDEEYSQMKQDVLKNL